MFRMCGPSQLATHCSSLSSLDSIGIAGFSHDFKTLEGQESAIANMFDALGRHKPSFGDIMHIILVAVFPILWRIPTKLTRLIGQFSSSVGEISKSLLTKTRTEKVGEDRSAMSLLSKFSNSFTTRVLLLMIIMYQ